MDLFHSLDNLKSQLASVAFCRNTGVYNVRNGAVIELPVVVSINGFLVIDRWRSIVEYSCYLSCYLLLLTNEV